MRMEKGKEMQNYSERSVNGGLLALYQADLVYSRGLNERTSNQCLASYIHNDVISDPISGFYVATSLSIISLKCFLSSFIFFSSPFSFI